MPFDFYITLHYTKEPTGLLRSDGKRPDVLTFIPWQRGKPLAWDVTVINTLADSLHLYCCSFARQCSLIGRWKKVAEILQLTWFLFVSAHCNGNIGPINTSGIEFISELGRRLEMISGDLRERSFLFQRLSMTVQRFNCVAFRGSFVVSDPDL